jgi:hypothetical protein
MSEDLLLNDTINQRGWTLPTPLVLVNNILNLPPGAIINARLANLQLNPQFLDLLSNANIVQGSGLANPNSVPVSGVTRSLVVSSYDSSLAGTGYCNTLLSDDTCSLGIGTLFDAIIASKSSSMSGPLADLLKQCVIIDSDTCTITNASTTALQNCGISSSTGSTIRGVSGATGLLKNNEIHGSSTGIISLAATSTADIQRCSIIATSTGTQETIGDADLLGNVIIGSDTCNLSNSSITAAALSKNNVILASASGSMTISATSTLPTNYNLLAGTSGCIQTSNSLAGGGISTSSMISSVTSNQTSLGGGSLTSNQINASVNGLQSTGGVSTGSLSRTAQLACSGCTQTLTDFTQQIQTATIASESCSLTSAATTGTGIQDFACVGTASGTIGANGGAHIKRSCTLASVLPIMTSNGTGNGIDASSIMSSDTCQLTQGDATISKNNSIISSNLSIINTSGASSTATGNLIAAGASSNITTTAGGETHSQNYIIGGLTNNVTNSGASPISQSGLLGSRTSTITQSGTGASGIRQGNIIGCSGCTVSMTGSQPISDSCIIGSANSSITQNAAFPINQSIILASNNGTINSTANTGQSVVLASSNNGLITGGNRNLGMGSTPTIAGFNDVFALSATATASSQAIFGARVDITGTGNNLTIGAGYGYPALSIVRPMANVAIDTTILTTHDALHITSTGAITITFPTAASLSSTYPSGSTRTWYVTQSTTSTPAKIALSGADTFKNKTGWTQLQLPRENSAIEVAWTNAAGTPGWTIRNKLRLGATADMTTANNFGTSPPKSDAAQLPTSTSAANHQTLTTTAYVTANTLVSDNPQTFTQSGAVITLPHTGYYRFRYMYNVQQTATVGATYYIIRSDVNNITAGATIGNSYAESGGWNVVSGTRYVEVLSDPVFLNVSTQVALRLSQDSTQTIVSTASLIFARLEITAEI